MEDVPLSSVGFKPAYNAATNVRFAADGSMQLILSGVQGTRVQSLGGYNTYGMYQVGHLGGPFSFLESPSQ